MKRIFTQIAIVTAAFLGASCSKDDVSSEYLVDNPSEVAKVTITVKGDTQEGSVIMFRDATVYRKSEMEGKSWFCAMSGGKMVYDAFMLSIYFDCIDMLNPGDEIIPDRCMFSFYFSSDSRATTHEHQGTITLAAKGEDNVIMHFDKVIFTCFYGEYLIDGYLGCPLQEEYVY